MTFKSSVERFFSQLFSGIMLGGLFILIGIFFGILAGGIAALFGGIVYWSFTIDAYQALYENRSLFGLVFFSIFSIGIPIGLMIGVTMGLHFVIYKLYTPHSMVWAVITGFGSVSGLWISGFSADANNQLGFLIYVGFVGLITGWFTGKVFHKISIQEFFTYNKAFTRPLIIISSITGFLLMLFLVYSYFNFWLSLQNIHS